MEKRPGGWKLLLGLVLFLLLMLAATFFFFFRRPTDLQKFAMGFALQTRPLQPQLGKAQQQQSGVVQRVGAALKERDAKQ